MSTEIYQNRGHGWISTRLAGFESLRSLANTKIDVMPTSTSQYHTTHAQQTDTRRARPDKDSYIPQTNTDHGPEQTHTKHDMEHQTYRPDS